MTAKFPAADTSMAKNLLAKDPTAKWWTTRNPTKMSYLKKTDNNNLTWKHWQQKNDSMMSNIRNTLPKNSYCIRPNTIKSQRTR